MEKEVSGEEIVKREVIQFVGLNELDEFAKDKVKVLCTSYHDKLKRLTHNITSLKIHIKQHSNDGGRINYFVNIKAIAPTKIFEVDKDEWDIALVMHKAFKALYNEIEHHLNSK
jgi:hypothetical protein